MTVSSVVGTLVAGVPRICSGCRAPVMVLDGVAHEDGSGVEMAEHRCQ